MWNIFLDDLCCIKSDAEIGHLGSEKKLKKKKHFETTVYLKQQIKQMAYFQPYPLDFTTFSSF